MDLKTLTEQLRPESQKTLIIKEQDLPLGPAGEKALEDFKRRAREAESRASAKAKRAGDLEAENTRLLGAQISAKVENAILRSAAGKFWDVEDAVLHLGGADVVDDQGNVDMAVLNTKVDELLERKPHLASSGRPAAPRPNQGPSTTPKGAADDHLWASALKRRGLATQK